MQSSSKAHPCPCCQRTRTSHCRFDLDAPNPIVLCHNGVSSGPPQNLRIGDTTDFAGITWALIRTNAGHSGNSHEFRPHRPLDRRSRRQYRRQQALQQVNDLHDLQADLQALDALANEALDIPTLEMMLDADIRSARDQAERAYNASKQMLSRVIRIKRLDATVTPVWEQLTKTSRDLKYQLADLDRYCANPAAYWQAFILNQLTPTPQPIPEPDPSDWMYWQQQQRGAA